MVIFTDNISDIWQSRLGAPIDLHDLAEACAALIQGLFAKEEIACRRVGTISRG